MHVVYIYKCPEGIPFYVGKGTVQRARNTHPSCRSDEFTQTLERHGRDRVQLEIIECDSDSQACDLERARIATLLSSGVKLVNHFRGGAGKSDERLLESAEGWADDFMEAGRPMDSTTFQSWMSAMGLSVRSAADLLGCSPATVQDLAVGKSRDTGKPIKYDKRTALACIALAKGLKPWSAT